MNLNDVAKLIQDYLSDSPLVVLGSGASVPYGLPTMSGLASVLRKDALLQMEKDSTKCKRSKTRRSDFFPHVC